MQKLSEKEWREFCVGDLFNCRLSAGDNKLSELNEGKKPLISAGTSQNGVAGFIEVGDGKSECFSKDSLTVDMFGKSFVHHYEFYSVSHGRVNILEPLEKNYQTMTDFISCCLDVSFLNKFSYNTMCSNARLTRNKVMLPVTDQDEPDYEYMEQYVEQLRKKKLEQYKTFAKKQIAELEYKEVPALGEKEWASVRLGVLGPVSSGRDIYAQERVAGKIPYITSGSTCNGIGYFVSNENSTLDSGYVAVNRNGSVGIAFYHPYKSLLGNDCRKIHIKERDRNPFVGLFIAMCISKQSICFSYSRKLGTARAKKMQIMLPVADAGKPDYDYMEQYVKNMMLKKYQQYFDYLEN